MTTAEARNKERYIKRLETNPGSMAMWKFKMIGYPNAIFHIIKYNKKTDTTGHNQVPSLNQER